MKVGIRTPNLKKRIRARTTGKYKRKIKSTLNPLYGKKGMGYIKNPKRALKNKIYHATTVDALTPLAPAGKKKTKSMKSKEATGKANIESIEISIVAGEMIVPPKKTKLVWGIVLAAFGLIGLAGVGQAGSSIALYIIICIAFMIGGVLLIVLYSRERKQYNIELQDATEREAREQRLADSRLELEQAKVDAELQQMKEEADAVRSCPACGAVSKGRFCEYCGSRIPD